MLQAVVTPYKTTHKVRIVTAASLFDGHDASINIMRRILQASGAEVIHLGHNRSVAEVVDAAIQEDAQAIAMTSYQGGHVEYLKYMYDLLRQRGAGHIRIFGGGGGTILPSEIAELHDYGIARIFSPDDGREMGLQGMINYVLAQADFLTYGQLNGEAKSITSRDPVLIARTISVFENEPAQAEAFLSDLRKLYGDKPPKHVPVLGITGTGGAGKSSLTDELVRRFLRDKTESSIAILSIDPTKRKTGGALLGDRIRMNSIHDPRVYMRSMATREANISISRAVKHVLELFKYAGYDLIIVETAGIGQSDSQITEVADLSLYVMTPEYGAATQLEKIDMLDFADVIALNKFDKRGAPDALRDVKKQVQRNRQLFNKPLDEMPVYGTMASQFNDPGVNRLYYAVFNALAQKTGLAQFATDYGATAGLSEKIYIIPPDRTRYLAEIAEASDRYDAKVEKQAELARRLFQLRGAMYELQAAGFAVSDELKLLAEDTEKELAPETRRILEQWPAKCANYQNVEYVYSVRGKEIRVPNFIKSLSGLEIPKIAVPKYKDLGEIVRWSMKENFPGEFPYTAGIYPFKRTNEDPTRMFAGEGGPERTNKRFHYLSRNMPAARLSTAFDSVTLYGEDPHTRPDIYGKIGNSGVSVATLDDAKKLYSGFDLCAPTTSVSMTINGPAPIILAFFMNAAIDQACEQYITAQGLWDQVNEKLVMIFTKRYAAEHYGEGCSISIRAGDRVVITENSVAADILRNEISVGSFVSDFISDGGKVNSAGESEAVRWRGLWIPKWLYEYMPHYQGR